MRKVLGGAVLVLGTGVLGWYGTSRMAPEMEARVAEAAQVATEGSVHGLMADVSGRDITLSGLADSAAERDGVLAALDAVDGRRVVRDETTLLQRAEPYVFEFERSATTVGIRGNVPSEAVRETLGPSVGAAVGQLELAAGAPDDFGDAVSASAGALNGLLEGRVLIEDTAVTVSGLAADPAARDRVLSTLNTLPPTYDVTTDIALLDDGTPFRINADFGRASGLVATGKLPEGMTEDFLAALPDVDPDLDLEVAAVPDADGTWPGVAGRAAEALGALETGSLSLIDRALTLSGVATRAGRDVAQEALTGLPDGYTADVDIAIFDDGAPFALEAALDGDAATASGKLPFGVEAGALASAFGGDIDVAGVTEAEIEADTPVFADTALAGLTALGALQSGTLNVSESALTLRGVGSRSEREAAELALSAVAEGVGMDVAIDLFDDGSPFALSVESDGAAATAAGKLPFGLDPKRIEAALGVAVDTDAVAIAEVDGDGAFSAALDAGLTSLAALESGTLDVGTTGIALAGVGTRAARDAATATLAGLPAEIDITLLDDGAPIALTAIKTADGVAEIAGKAPFGTDAAALGVETLDDAVQVAEIDANAEGFVPLAAAGLGALGLFESGTMEVTDAAGDGSDAALMLRGSILSPAERAEIDAALAAAPGMVTVDATLIDDGTPMTLTVSKDGDGAQTAAGKVPVGFDLGGLTGDVVNSPLPTRDPEFEGAVSRGLAALDGLTSGELVVQDGAPSQVSLTGVARTPAEADAVRAALGTGASVDLSTLDDGAPADFTVVFDAAEGVIVSGKLPDGLTLADVAAQLAVPEVTDGGVTEGLTGDADAARAQLDALAAWLPELDEARLDVAGEGRGALVATPAPGVDLELLAAGLAVESEEAVSFALTESPPPPPTGSTRVNLASGVSERFSGVAWLPNYTFDATLANCDATTTEILDRSRINFVTGSARLDARSVRAVNALSGAIQHCVANDTSFRVEVGGHTDSQGSEEGNLLLSQQRAFAVAEALVERGVGPGVLVAEGYGESQPIADNDTEEGRAANRRTTFTWSRDE